MIPYYDHAGITIYHGDCREVLPFAEVRRNGTQKTGDLFAEKPGDCDRGSSRKGARGGLPRAMDRHFCAQTENQG